MRYLIFVALICFLLLPACERANPPVQHDAGPVQPPDDGGSATLDARTPRPGAGPLDPDLTIDCEQTSTVVSKNAETGAIAHRTGYTTITWTEEEPPRFAWVCPRNPQVYLSCGDAPSTECEIQGPELLSRCMTTIWHIDPDGAYFAICGYWAESDLDGDGVFEPAHPFDFRGAYVAIVR